MPNRVFFFGAIDPQWQRTSSIAPEGFPLRSLGSVNQDRRIVAYAAKGTWQAAAGHRLDASFFGDPAVGDNGPQRYTALLRTDTSGFSKLDQYGGHNQTVRYEGAVTPTWLVEASFARAKNSIVEIPSVNPAIGRRQHRDAAGPQRRIGFFEVGNTGVNWQYQAKGTNVIHHHSLRYGVEYNNISYANEINRTGPTFTLVDGTQTATGAEIEIDADPTFGRIFRVVRANTSNVRDTRQHYVNAFVQDTWNIGSRLTVNPGIRYEREALTGTLADLTLSNNWAPRIGAAFNPTGSGKAKIDANQGFFYSKVPNDGVRYIHRDIPRVLEDVQPFPIVAGDLGIPGATTVDYTLTNPGPETPTASDLGASFEKAIHRYDAIEFTADKRFANRWSLLTSYRYSRLRGTFEGFFRDDNGQSDPGISSLFDLPTNDPSYTAIGVPQFGYRGDVRFLGALGEGPLPLDHAHQVKVFGNYEFPFALDIGAGLSFSSGKPLTALAAHPVYGNADEIPEGPRGSGFETVDGFLTRTRPTYTAAVHADYHLNVHKGQRVVLLADMFNLFNQQRALDYDPATQTSFPVMNPDFGQPSRTNLAQLQTPRQIRLGIRYEF